MKNSILILTVTTFLAGGIISGCNLSEKKVQKAEDSVVNTMDNAEEMNQALNDSIKQFKMASEQKIDEYQQDIADLKAKMKTEKAENKALYEKNLAVLQKKSDDLITKLNDYKYEGQSNWDAFKNEFTHDMNELGTAFKDLTVNNVK